VVDKVLKQGTLDCIHRKGLLSLYHKSAAPLSAIGPIAASTGIYPDVSDWRHHTLSLSTISIAGVFQLADAAHLLNFSSFPTLSKTSSSKRIAALSCDKATLGALSTSAVVPREPFADRSCSVISGVSSRCATVDPNMSTSTATASIIGTQPSCRNRSMSSVSRTSSSSGERTQNEQKKSKSNAFKSFFAVKEPSAVAFQRLAEQRKKELAEKGQKYPFGVPQGQIPAWAEEDYKKAKERAKERARHHQEAKERLKMQEEHDRALAKVRAQNRPPNELTELEDEVRRLRTQLDHGPIEYRSLDPRPSTSSLSSSSPPVRKTHSRWRATSLDSLPEISATNSSTSTQSSPPQSMPPTPLTPPASANGIRRDIAPWEDPEEEEFPMRESSKKKGYFSTFRRR
jgi:hypothetical protein